MFNFDIPPQVREINDPLFFTLNSFDERSLGAFDKALHKAKDFRQSVFPIKIQSDGGTVAIMLGFMSLMKKYREDGMIFVGSVMGSAASAACVIFLYCDHRYMGEYANLLFHASYLGIEGPMPTVKAKVDFYTKEEVKINEVLSRHLKKPKNWLENQLKKRGSSEDWMIGSEDSMALGLATKIGIPNITLVIDAGFSIS